MGWSFLGLLRRVPAIPVHSGQDTLPGKIGEDIEKVAEGRNVGGFRAGTFSFARRCR